MRWKIVLGFLVIASLIGLFNGLRSQLFTAHQKSTATQNLPLLPKNVSAIDYPELKVFMGQSNLQLLDARPKVAYDLGHLPGAVSVPTEALPQILEKIKPPLSEQALTVIYCDGGACFSSITEAKILGSLGFTKLRVYLGGWEDYELKSRSNNSEVKP